MIGYVIDHETKIDDFAHVIQRPNGLFVAYDNESIALPINGSLLDAIVYAKPIIIDEKYEIQVEILKQIFNHYEIVLTRTQKLKNSTHMKWNNINMSKTINVSIPYVDLNITNLMNGQPVFKTR